MAEITKVSTPLVPKENLGFKNRPVTDMAFELRDTSKVHAPAGDGKILDRQAENHIFRDNIGKASVLPLLRDADELIGSLKKLITFAEMEILGSKNIQNSEIKDIIGSMFISENDMLASLMEQDKSQVLFKGAVYDQLREIMAKYSDQDGIKNAGANLLRTIEKSINTTGSLKTILVGSENLLDYMFKSDREQFSQYLEGLAKTLLPGSESTQIKEELSLGDIKNISSFLTGAETDLSQREVSSILKGNLLPLLGEIVVKYHQNENIRDTVMVVVHNIVRVDKGSPEALRDAINGFLSELRQNVNITDDFKRSFILNIFSHIRDAKEVPDKVMDNISQAIIKSFSSESISPAQIRQAENLLFNLMQNQASVMNLLHFVLPVETQNERIFAELYIDPNCEKKKKSPAQDSRRIFLTFDSEYHGTFELLFLQEDNHIEFEMWCPAALVSSLAGMKRHFSDIIAMHGYTLDSFNAAEYIKGKRLMEIFPGLLSRRVGVDVKI